MQVTKVVGKQDKVEKRVQEGETGYSEKSPNHPQTLSRRGGRL